MLMRCVRWFVVLGVAVAVVSCSESDGSRQASLEPTISTAASSSTTTVTVTVMTAGQMTFDSSGFTADEWVDVSQCRSSSVDLDGCGLNPLETHADQNGRVRGDYTARQWIFTPDAWVDCMVEACELQIHNESLSRLVRSVVDLSGVAASPEPDVIMTVQPPAPYKAGQEITITVDGAPPGIAGAVQVCTKVGANSSSSGLCAYPASGSFTTDSVGSATLRTLRLPELPCSTAASCELTWDPGGYAYPPLVAHDIDYT